MTKAQFSPAEWKLLLNAPHWVYTAVAAADRGTISTRRTEAKALQEITEREREVLALVARGHSNAEIAELLVLSEGTVKTHIKRIFMKLNLRDRTQAVILAYDVGLVQPKGS